MLIRQFFSNKFKNTSGTYIHKFFYELKTPNNVEEHTIILLNENWP